MASLIVRNLEEEVVQKLREEAVRQKVSTEEAHRRLLRRILLDHPLTKPLPFGKFLLTIPPLGEGEPADFPRSKDPAREVEL